MNVFLVPAETKVVNQYSDWKVGGMIQNLGLDSRRGKDIFIFSNALRPKMRPIHLPSFWVPRIRLFLCE